MSNNDEQANPGIDPSFWRGLTQPRISRRQALGYAGAGALSTLLWDGVAGASSLPNASMGTKAWWKKQKLHHTVNFANWP
ncbi:MAG TPA: hypothetical protein VMU68_03065, partial [Acidimicrobiales bacterium]|nr:hypothetical protein [Acidimicrobiales bacterium]